MVREKDPLWSHAEVLNNSNRFKCKYCGRLFSGGLTRLRYHLSGLKGNDVDVCSAVPSDLQARVRLALDRMSYKRSRIEFAETQMGGFDYGISSSSVNEMGEMTSQPLMIDRGLNQATGREPVKKKDKTVVDDSVAAFLIQNNIAFNVVEQKSFIDLVKGVAEFGPSYSLPDYSTLRTKLIPRAKKRVDRYIEDVKKSWEKYGCSIMYDTWSDRGRCFINFIAHSPRGCVFLQSVEVSEERKTIQFLKELSLRVIDMVGPEHAVQFITDNTSYFDSIGDMLASKYPTMYKTKCVAHGIHCLLEDIYEHVPWLQSIIDNAKFIQSYMYQHTRVTALMREATNGRELKKPCASLFASNFLVLQSLLGVESELRLFVSSSGWRDLSSSKTHDAKLVAELIQDSSFWSEGREVIEVLEPLFRALRLIDHEGSTTCYLFQAMEMARDKLKKKADEDGQKYGRIFTDFERRRKDDIIHPIHAFAASLDPSYITSPTFKQTWEMKEGMFYLFEHVVHEDEKDLFMKEYRDYIMKLPSLFNPATFSMMRTYHPRIWWEFNGDLLPVLQKYAIRVLSQPCSSSPFKRSWSAYEVAQTKRQNRHTPDMLGLLIYCRMNTMMMHNIEDKLLKDADPIDLNTLNEWPNYGEEVEPCPPPLDEETSSSSLDGASMSDSPSASYNSFPIIKNICLTYVDDEDEVGDLSDDY